ncbi:MAG: hypothetical protein QUS14_01060 [Pyrinomonadaceae bacterium]|nr:hypothetical protein [Pyrinomonadaceae bacterium]
MISVIPKSPDDPIVFASSLREDVWHRQTDPKSYELWHFDALSDDGSELISINFLDNFVFSADYNKPTTDNDEISQRSPAVEFMYCRKGQAYYRAAIQYRAEQFEASEIEPSCHIGNSYFNYLRADYGSGFNVVVDLELPRGRRMEAHFEWLSIEENLLEGGQTLDKHHHSWNVVATRSDVTGRITIVENDGSVSDVRHFRGTGYHDHRIDNRWLADTVTDWYCGRAHFADATTVFARYKQKGDESAANKLIVVRDGVLRVRDAGYEDTGMSRDKLGVKYPKELTLLTDDGLRLVIRPKTSVCSTIYLVRFFCEATLTLRDKVERNTTGIVDFLSPSALKNRWINWLSDV